MKQLVKLMKLGRARNINKNIKMYTKEKENFFEKKLSRNQVKRIFVRRLREWQINFSQVLFS
jgi:DNA polymerase III delta subunit